MADDYVSTSYLANSEYQIPYTVSVRNFVAAVPFFGCWWVGCAAKRNALSKERRSPVGYLNPFWAVVLPYPA
jgi:hypothetical protein